MIPIDFKRLIGREPPASRLEETQWFYAALVWCHRKGADVTVAQRAFERQFGYPPKRWFDKPQEEYGYRVPASVVALCELERVTCAPA